MSTAWAWKMSLLLCNGGQKWPFFSFFLPPGKLIEVFFFLVPTRKILWYLSTTYTKISSKSEKKFTKWNFMTLSSNWKVKIFTTLLIKSWLYEFSSLIYLKGIKKFIIALAKNFWPWRPGGCKVGANILHGFDCIAMQLKKMREKDANWAEKQASYRSIFKGYLLFLCTLQCVIRTSVF